MNSIITKNYQKYIFHSNYIIVNLIKNLNSDKLRFKYQVGIDKNFKVKGKITYKDIRRVILANTSLSTRIT